MIPKVDGREWLSYDGREYVIMHTHVTATSGQIRYSGRLLLTQEDQVIVDGDSRAQVSTRLACALPWMVTARMLGSRQVGAE